MTLRQKLACVGLTVFGLQIASAAAGGAPLADRLRLWLDPEQLLAASVRMELGAPPVDAPPTPEEHQRSHARAGGDTRPHHGRRH